MKHYIYYIILLLLATAMLGCKSNKPNPVEQRAIIPKPNALVWQSSTFTIDNSTRLIADNEIVTNVAEYAQHKLKMATGWTLNISKKKAGNNCIALEIDSCIVNKEGYELEVNKKYIKLKANSPQGLFYAFQSLLQLLPAAVESNTASANSSWQVPGVLIKDAPRFPYRGMHLDVCRHFVPVTDIKKHLDMMAMLKLNRFHWHLTEDQAWRIEIKAYPKLTRIGSQRIEGDGSTYKGYYTQAEIKDIIAYAQERMIDVIPEIELPGHALAALTAYPEYSCTGGPFTVRNIWGVEADVYCAGKETTFAFLENIIDEVCQLFPSPYFHIGGDECPKERWKTCSLCQKRMRQEHLENEHQLQSYFVQRIEHILQTKGKKMIGWDEILEGGLAANATVMSWRGEAGGIAAAEQAHNVIMTPSNWCYLDHYQGSPNVEPVAIGGYTTLEDTYNYEPVPDTLSLDKQKHILGTQGNVWTEYMYSPQLVEYRVYPRIIALAEVGWTAPEKKDFQTFCTALENLYPRMDYHKINYHIPLPEGVCNNLVFTDTAHLAFSTTRPIDMVYTTDNSEPTSKSKRYTTPLQFTENTLLKIASILPHGKMSTVRSIYIKKEDFAPAQNVKTKHKGLIETYTKGKFQTVDELDNISQWQKKSNSQPSKPQDYKQPSASILTGYVHIPENGVYEFHSDIDQVYIDDKLLINNDKEVKRYSRHNAMRALAQGKHSVKLISINNIVGGWPSAWNERLLYIKKAGKKDFRKIEDNWYSH